MREWKDKTVRRDIFVERMDYKPCHVEGIGMCNIYSFQESYVGEVVNYWEETIQGKIVQQCTKGLCNTRNLITEFSEDNPKKPVSHWMCPKCTRVQGAARARVDSRKNYKEAFPKRVMAFSRALRKRHPELNSRKSRVDNDIIINGTRWEGNRNERKKINILGYEFHLHVNTFHMQEDNDGQRRTRFTVQDISPMFDEHFRDQGHKGGIMAVNR